MQNLPNHIILQNKVYKLEISKWQSRRAFERDLIDYGVKGTNPLSSSDKWSTLLGMSEELNSDYSSYNQPMPLEWVLFRFLTHHVRNNSIHIIKGLGGEALSRKSFNDYVGKSISDTEAKLVVSEILNSWISVFPNEPAQLNDIYISSDIPFDTLIRALNSLKHQGYVQQFGENRFLAKPSLFVEFMPLKNNISFDRKRNRYFQEITIEAKEPFCFVIMPLKNEEFDQRLYNDVMKPYIENTFKIKCNRIDEDKLPDRIDNKIYSYLLRSAFVIAEVTTLNPNVMYELGLAHMLEKNCIILTQTPIDKVPFDINRIRAEQYTSDKQLTKILQESISALAFKAK